MKRLVVTAFLIFVILAWWAEFFFFPQNATSWRPARPKENWEAATELRLSLHDQVTDRALDRVEVLLRAPGGQLRRACSDEIGLATASSFGFDDFGFELVLRRQGYEEWRRYLRGDWFPPGRVLEVGLLPLKHRRNLAIRITWDHTATLAELGWRWVLPGRGLRLGAEQGQQSQLENGDIVSIPQVPLGAELVLTAMTHDGRSGARLSTTVAEDLGGLNQTLSLRLESTMVDGQIRFRDGRPLSHTAVLGRFVALGVHGKSWGMTDAEGRFALAVPLSLCGDAELGTLEVTKGSLILAPLALRLTGGTFATLVLDDTARERLSARH